MKTFRIFPLILILCLVLAFAAPGAYALDAPEVTGKAALIIDLDTGEILYEMNKDQQRAPASLTKVMTMLVALDALEEGRFSLEDTVTAQADCLTGLAEDSSTAGIVPGTQLSGRELLYAIMLASANEGCNVLATYLSGSVSAFVEEMNQKAAELGCVNTHFVNPNGLPAENHYSSAYDLYLITSAAMKYPLFMEIANTLSYQFNDPNINNGYPIQNSNALINVNASHSRGGRYLYEGASGVKTGYTNAAGYCLISTAQRDGINVLAIAMGCLGELNGDAEDFWNFKDSITMYDWVFDNFSHRSILSTSENITSVTVELSDGDSIMLHPQKGITALLPDDVAVEDIQRSITVYEDKLVAPIAAGTPLGHLTLSLDGEELGSVELVNSSEVALSKLEYMKQRIAEVFSNGWVIALVVLVLVFLFVYLALVVRYRRLRQQHLRQRRRMEQRRRLEQERMYAESRQHREPSQVDPSQRYNDPFDLDHFFDDER